MRATSKLLAFVASVTFLLGIMVLPLRPANAQVGGGFGGSTATYQIAGISQATVYVNGIPAGAGTKYTDNDRLTASVSAGGFVDRKSVV